MLAFRVYSKCGIQLHLVSASRGQQRSSTDDWVPVNVTDDKFKQVLPRRPGSTVEEVLGTLIIRMIHDPELLSYCNEYCNCNSVIDWETEAVHAATQPEEQPCQ